MARTKTTAQGAEKKEVNVAKLISALEFYANNDNWRARGDHGEDLPPIPTCPAGTDHGQIAREALEEA